MMLAQAVMRPCGRSASSGNSSAAIGAMTFAFSAMNGDWDANGRQVTSVRVTRSGNRIDVMFDGKNTAHIRVNWAVMWRG